MVFTVFNSDKDEQFVMSSAQSVAAGNLEGNLVIPFPEYSRHSVTGFGGAFTEATGINYNKLTAEGREEFIESCFDKIKGNGYNICRLHMSSSDFTAQPYQNIEENDFELKTFNVDREKEHILPMIKHAQKYADIKLFISPWSPPAFMKDNNSRTQGGKLLEKYWESWANYFVKFIDFLKAEDITVWGATVQNEPGASMTWESCRYTAEEERDFVKYHLGKKLYDRDVKLMFWDHNREKLVKRAQVMYGDNDSEKYIYGAACHWYSGDHFRQIDILKRAYPQKDIILSEASVEMNLSELETAEYYAYDIIGCFNNGISAFVDWNLMLDNTGGPFHNRFSRQPQGDGCRSQLRYDNDSDKIVRELPYYYTGHFSRFIKSGAKIVPTSKFTDQLQTLSAVNTDNTLVTVILNKTDKDQSVNLQVGGEYAPVEVKSHSIITATTRLI